jgi:mannose-6-phosphate isomerase-like protein (cupin superfamily)
MGCGESCPVVPGLKREDWDLEDPKGKSHNRVREIRDEIRAKVRALIKSERLRPPSGLVFPLSKAPWREELPKKLAKIGIVESTRIRVLRLERGYDEPGWCTRPHTLYVINGRLALRFDDSAVPMEPGDVAMLPAGIEHRHRPEPLTDIVELLLVEPATDPRE